ncbi:hypothetical protein HanRHA438_Chr05g0231541 [Helianthus annuus]|nr:hypothetical protein HanHA300_Chr05g0182071 [Helianthus annuus]KAJ0577738.1 hypothetical protein HanIR_Chr05g0239441 [Helianthus annuus]KAJ0585125.1 hypothetical protein HanHA89_Chr05g0196741 [Helianthus annuus]KAJ0919602.1 hypothetical protein HanRHA438_Chr05g0231541 [Helianthus annuus]KAJ0923345.1 hypothetical protein HanPSC8_Chr05g0214841 [Helianthus annuus]
MQMSIDRKGVWSRIVMEWWLTTATFGGTTRFRRVTDPTNGTMAECLRERERGCVDDGLDDG